MTKECVGGRSFAGVGIIVLILAALVSVSHAKNFFFTPTGGTHATVLLQADFEINIKAFENNMVVAAWVGGSGDHSNIELYGSTGQQTFLELRFPDEGISWGILFEEKSAQDVKVDRIVQFTPTKIFPPFNKLNYALRYEDKDNTNYNNALRSFQCDATTKTTYIPANKVPGDVSFDITVTIYNLRMQAFHVKNGQFSPSIHCSSDHVVEPTHKGPRIASTPAPPPTEPPVFPPIPGPNGEFAFKNKFILNNTIDNSTIKCISMEGRISFEIAYFAFDGGYHTNRKWVKIGIPERATVNGECREESGSQRLRINFLRNWAVEFIFRMNVAYSFPSEQGDFQSKMDYSIDSVTLKYSIDDDLRFPKAYKSAGTNFSISMTEHDDLPRKKASNGFFTCSTTKKFKMSDDVTLILSDFRFKAFIQDQDTNFYGIPNTCEEDMKQIGASTVVIVVGCLVITFSLVVLIAVMALMSMKCRTKRRRRGYNSM